MRRQRINARDFSRIGPAFGGLDPYTVERFLPFIGVGGQPQFARLISALLGF